LYCSSVSKGLGFSIIHDSRLDPVLSVGGLQNYGSSHYISGLADDVFIFNDALSASEMAYIEQHGLVSAVPEP
jgi:hypothetical protein